MENFPKSMKKTKEYSALSWDANEGRYKYTETITHYCTKEALLEYKESQQRILSAEQARDSNIVIQTTQEEIDWVDNALN